MRLMILALYSEVFVKTKDVKGCEKFEIVLKILHTLSI